MKDHIRPNPTDRQANGSASLDGKVAIVTGASSGLGVAFAEGLARAGANVVICARRVNRLDETRELIERLGRRCLSVPADVSRPVECQRVVDEAMRGKPAVITRHGKRQAVVVSYEEWERLSHVPSFGRLLMAAPLKGNDLPDRNNSDLRPADL